jgi:hypothetical protein
MAEMSSKERLRRQARGQEVDQIPTVGGWIGSARTLAELAGLTEQQYVADPLAGLIRAHKALGVDGMIRPTVRQTFEQMRSGAVTESDHASSEPEALRERAGSIPDSAQEILATFDPVAEEARYRDYFESALAGWQGIVPIPNFWEIGGHFPLYREFGYVAFLSACALYPEEVGKIWWAKSLHSRERAKILVRLYDEYDLVPLMFCGEDVCNNGGPMVSPEFLRSYYFPTVRLIIEPLIDAGIRLVHHCDGNVTPIIDDLLSTGFSGLQGFQYELGVDPYELKKHRTVGGEQLIFFAGLSVSRTLPFGTPDDVKEEVDYFLDFTDGGRGLFLFTSNVTGVEVPTANIRTGYEYVREWDPREPRHPIRRRWPWARREDS